MKKSQDENLSKILVQMPEQRVRPSILAPTSSVLGHVVHGSSIVLGQEKTDVLLGAIEKGIQNDVDEQLRILNENEVENTELRKLLIKMRDESFELMEKSGKQEKIERKIEDEKSTDYLIYQAGSWATYTLMRVARQV